MKQAKYPCPECGSVNCYRLSKNIWSGRHKVDRYKCNACGRTYNVPPEETTK